MRATLKLNKRNVAKLSRRELDNFLVSARREYEALTDHRNT
jgi:hypothetical protein